MSKLRLSLCVVLFLAAGFFSSAAFSSDVEFFSPAGEVKKVRQVAVRFAEQMVALGDPREVAPFNIACPAPGRARWADQRNWIYDFDQDLPAGITCTFTLKKGLVTVRGRHIEGGQQFSFNTGGPAIIQSEPNSYVPIDENQIFILGLDAPASADSIKQHAACLVDGVPEQIPVRLITGDQRKKILDLRSNFLTSYYFAILKFRSGRGQPVVLGVEERGSEREKFLKLRDAPNSPIVVLQCQRTLPSNTRVTLLWDQGIRSLSGLPTSAPQSLPFTTRKVFDATFTCDRVNKDAGCIPALPMNLQFSAPIKVSDAEKIRLVPRKGKPVYAVISKEARKNGFLDSVTFPVPLPEQTDFKLQLPANLKDDADRPLSNAGSFPLSVHTDENPPLAKFAATFGIVELNASRSVPPLLPVTLRNVEPVLAGNIAGTAGKGEGGAIGGKVMRGASESDVVGWLRRLQSIDQEAYNEPDRGPGKRSIFERSDSLIPIKVPKKFGGKAFEVVGIPLNGPGFYVVELASPRLGEALFDEKRPYYVHAAALVTNLSVHFKKGRESSLVWVTSLDKGEAVRDADVAVRDCSGKTYFQGRTDAEGLLRIGQQLPDVNGLPVCVGYNRQYFVTARKGNDFSFVFSGWNEGISLWRFNAFQGEYLGHNVAHAVMDRTLVRAGETIHLKLFLRQQTGPGFAPVDFTPPKKITIEHLGSEEKYELPVNWDGQGIATADWQVPKDAKQGAYAVEVMVPRGIDNAGEFRVEAFRVPTMKAILQGPAEPLVNAEQATLGIQINYLSGGGASNLPVKLRGQVLPQAVSFPDYEDYTFANGGLTPGPERVGSEPWYMGDYELAEGGGEEGDGEEEAPAPVAAKASGELLPVQNLRLDMAGSAQATFSKLRKTSAPRVIQAEIEYSDPNGEILNARTRIPLWPSRVVVGIKPEGWIATADHLKFYAVVLDLKGKPVPGAEVTVDALQREYFSHRRRLLGGFYAFENRSEIKALGQLCRGTTDSKGLLICEVKSPASGNIILQASTRDAQGNASLANRELWVAGSGDWWFDASDSDRIDLLPEKKRYEPGDAARLQLRMPFKEATVLVTTEREGVMQSFVTHVTRDHAVIEVPIKDNYAPNVFISALAVRGRVDDVKPTALVDLGKPSFKMGLAEVNVGWGAHELKVKVATDRQTYKVREKAKVAIDVRRADGSLPPPGSEIALAAVDEGLLELKPNDSWALLDAMMRRRGIEVSTSTAQMQVIGKRHFGRKALAAGGGGGAGGRRSVRELFDTLLFWKARVKLDAQGHAEAEIPLNDSLTSFRIVAVANGGVGLFGTGSSSIASSQDLMLLSGLPPVIREQDHYRANFTVRNASDHAMEAVVSARADGGRAGPDHALAPIAVTLQKGESRDVGWTVDVPIGSDALKWDITVREKGKGEDGDHLRVSQKVIPAVAVRTFQATLMQLEKPESIQVRIPRDAIPGRGGVKVSFRKRLGDGLGGVQEFMSRYPYVCFEQIASKAVALQDQGAWNAHMHSIYSYLDGDGLVKYFTVMDQGDDTLTAYILSIADEAGYDIPDDARERMVRGLTGFVEGRVIRYSALPTADLNIRKIAAIAALSRTEQVNPKWLESIAIEPNLWPTSAVLDWLYILKRADNLPDRAQQMEAAQQIIRSRLNFQGTTMGFSTERSDALWWLMIDGDVNANRALLEFLDMDNWGPDIPRLVRGTLGRQQRGHWNTTVANAWGVLAMKKFSAKFESVPVTGSTTAAIGRDKFTADWRQSADGQQGMLPWPRAAADLDLKHQGDGKPWVTIQSLAAVPLKKPLFTGYRVVRKIIPIEQKKQGSWHKGDVMRIHLEINAQSDMSWVVVNDPIPSGASILGTGLGGDSRILTQGEQKRGWVWPAFEERTFDSFRSYYRFVPKGTFTVEYTVRLNNEGEFNLPTTRVEAMYAPEMFGELPNAKVTVLP
jgi:uncharacterized protein YfaS (alpha-2-macroglobulin family)